MMNLSKTAAEALRVMALFAAAGSDRVLACKSVAEQLDMPADTALVAIRRLIRRGLIGSLRGRSGGYFLACQPRQITLLDIVAATDWPLIQQVRLPHGVPKDKTLTLLEQTCQCAVAAAQSRLHQVTLADLVQMLAPKQRAA